MKEKIIISDFDGTVTKKDSLYYFFKEYASIGWLEVEKLWKERKIGSKECLLKEFNLVDNLSEKLILNYIKTLELDIYFREFINTLKHKNIDFIIVSDGVDYFINRILENNNLSNINVISNHMEFKNNNIELTCPNEYQKCYVNSGTCKCKVIHDLKNKYKEVIYIGDGTSDFCVAENACVDKLFAKDGLLKFCIEKNINHTKFETFKDVMGVLFNKV